MANLPINRDQAIELIKKYNTDKSDMNHFLESEAVMGGLAKSLGRDVEYWRMLGLLHDVDWGITKANTKEHLTKAPTILSDAGFDSEFMEDVISHGFGFDCAGLVERKREKEIHHALACSETITGLIHAYALMRKDIMTMEPDGLKKKFKDRAFAASIRRDIISECEQLGISLKVFFSIAINAIKEVRQEVGLQ